MESVLWIITYLLTCCTHIHKNDITSATSNIYNGIISLIKSTLLIAYLILWCTKNFFQLVILVSFPLKKIIFHFSYGYSLSHLTSCTPTKSNLHLANSLAAAVSEPALYTVPTFQVPNLMSLSLAYVLPQ